MTEAEARARFEAKRDYIDNLFNEGREDEVTEADWEEFWLYVNEWVAIRDAAGTE